MHTFSLSDSALLSSRAARFRRDLADNAYPGYVYGYPHKKAYRPLPAPVSLAQAWASEDRSRLFCYVHIPFCRQRCSFCNLFTYVPGASDRSPTSAYLDALGREMDSYAQTLGDARFVQLYLGGGTPTYLDADELRHLFHLLRTKLNVNPADTDGCIEASPETLDEAKVALLAEVGFQRVSLGVQSFDEQELHEVNRRFDFSLHDKALTLLARGQFKQLNVDLIYGLPGQTLQSWRDSLRQAIQTPATSLFLYPLYIRPLTGLGVRAKTALDSPTTHQMAAMYDLALELLDNAGFRQTTMRQFRRDAENHDVEYRCQDHGMVGLGAGARSYTTSLHYSTPWRMITRNIRAVIEEYLARDHSQIEYGIHLDDQERQRRYLLQTLLYEGVDLAEFQHRFDADEQALFADLWQLLTAERCVSVDAERIRLTAKGVRHADVIGQLFFSERVLELMAQWEYDR
jgi:oxygen-independent coproporphyrinogen-3 oxidase